MFPGTKNRRTYDVRLAIFSITRGCLLLLPVAYDLYHAPDNSGACAGDPGRPGYDLPGRPVLVARPIPMPEITEISDAARVARAAIYPYARRRRFSRLFYIARRVPVCSAQPACSRRQPAVSRLHWLICFMALRRLAGVGGQVGHQHGDENECQERR